MFYVRMAAVFALVIFVASVAAQGYSGNEAWIPAQHLIKVLRSRDVGTLDVTDYVELLSPSLDPHLEYISTHGRSDGSITLVPETDTEGFVLLEDIEHFVDFRCKAGTENRTILSTVFQDAPAFELARRLWERRNFIFITHDETCGSLDERQTYKPLELTADENDLKVEVICKHLPFGYPESMPAIDFTWDSSGSRDLTPRHPESHPKLARRDEDLINSTDLLKWKPVLEQEESIVNLTGFFSPSGIMELDCIGCDINFNFKYRVQLNWNTSFFSDMADQVGNTIEKGVDALGEKISGDDKEAEKKVDDIKSSWGKDPSEMIKKAFNKASMSITSRQDSSMRMKYRYRSSAGADYWCNIPGTCGWTGGMGGASLQDQGKFTVPGGKFKYPGGSKGSGFKAKTVGGLKLVPGDIGAGFWTDIAFAGNVNLTMPQIELHVAKDQSVSIDVLKNEEIENTLQPIVTVEKPELIRVDNPKFTLSAAIKIGASINISPAGASVAQCNIGGRFDFLKVSLALDEHENVTDGEDCKPGPIPAALGIKIDLSTGLLAWINAFHIFLNTGQLPFPLYHTWKAWLWCAALPEDKTLSDYVNEFVEKIEDMAFGNEWPKKYTMQDITTIEKRDRSGNDTAPHFYELTNGKGQYKANGTEKAGSQNSSQASASKPSTSGSTSNAGATGLLFTTSSGASETRSAVPVSNASDSSSITMSAAAEIVSTSVGAISSCSGSTSATSPQGTSDETQAAETSTAGSSTTDTGLSESSSTTPSPANTEILVNAGTMTSSWVSTSTFSGTPIADGSTSISQTDNTSCVASEPSVMTVLAYTTPSKPAEATAESVSSTTPQTASAITPSADISSTGAVSPSALPIATNTLYAAQEPSQTASADAKSSYWNFETLTSASFQTVILTGTKTISSTSTVKTNGPPCDFDLLGFRGYRDCLVAARRLELGLTSHEEIAGEDYP